MKKVLFILLIFLISCSGTKKLEKSNLVSSVKTDTEVSKKVDEKQTANLTYKTVKTADKKTEASESKNKVTETTTTEFDGSKPIVPGTGKPPVVRETVKTETETNQRDIKIQEGLTEKLNLQVDYTRVQKLKIDSLQDINAQLVAKNESKEDPVNNWWKWLLAGMAIPCIIWLVIRFNLLSFFLLRKI